MAKRPGHIFPTVLLASPAFTCLACRAILPPWLGPRRILNQQSRVFFFWERFVEFWSSQSVRARISYPKHCGSVPPPEKHSCSGIKGSCWSGDFLQTGGLVTRHVLKLQMFLLDPRTGPSFQWLLVLTTCGFEKKKWHQVHLLSLSVLSLTSPSRTSQVSWPYLTLEGFSQILLDPPCPSGPSSSSSPWQLEALQALAPPCSPVSLHVSHSHSPSWIISVYLRSKEGKLCRQSFMLQLGWRC